VTSGLPQAELIPHSHHARCGFQTATLPLSVQGGIHAGAESSPPP